MGKVHILTISWEFCRFLAKQRICGKKISHLKVSITERVHISTADREICANFLRNNSVFNEEINKITHV